MSDSFITFGAVHEYRELVTLGESGELLSSSQLPGMVHRGKDSGPIHIVDPLLGLGLPYTHPKPVHIRQKTDKALIRLSSGPFLGYHGHKALSQVRWPFPSCLNGGENEGQVSNGSLREHVKFKR